MLSAAARGHDKHQGFVSSSSHISLLARDFMTLGE